MSLFGYTALRDDLLTGCGDLIAYFRGAVEEDALSHAYLLEGAEGSGRHTLAYAVAASLTGDEEYGRKVLRGECQDVDLLGTEDGKKSIGIAPVRALKESAFIKPGELDFKFYILEDADLLTEQAQNALLKLLEEPPKAVYFFLLCENAASLLPTVRSRVMTVRMPRLSAEEMTEALCRDKKLKALRDASPDVFEAAVRTADGSFGRAAKILRSRSKKEAAPKDVPRELLGAMAKGTAALNLYAGLPREREELTALLTLFLTALRDLIAARRGCGPLLYFTDEEEAASLSAGFPLRTLIRCADLTLDILRRLGENANVGGVSQLFLCSLGAIVAAAS